MGMICVTIILFVNAVCSTVLLPDRVVQALNLKLEAVDTPAQPKYNGGLGPDYGTLAIRLQFVTVLSFVVIFLAWFLSRNIKTDVDFCGLSADAAAVRYRKSVVMAQQRRQQPLVMNQVQEIGLPQEWTY